MKYACIQNLMPNEDLNETYDRYVRCLSHQEQPMKKESFLIDQFCKNNNKLIQSGFVNFKHFYHTGVPDLITSVRHNSEMAKIFKQLGIVTSKELYQSPIFWSKMKFNIEIKCHTGNWDHQYNPSSELVDLLLAFYCNKKHKILDCNNREIPVLYVVEDPKDKNLGQIRQSENHTYLQRNNIAYVGALIDAGLILDRNAAIRLMEQNASLVAPDLYALEAKEKNIITLQQKLLYVCSSYYKNKNNPDVMETAVIHFELSQKAEDWSIISILSPEITDNMEKLRMRDLDLKDNIYINDLGAVEHFLDIYKKEFVDLIKYMHKFFSHEELKQIAIRKIKYRGSWIIAFQVEGSYCAPQLTRNEFGVKLDSIYGEKTKRGSQKSNDLYEHGTPIFDVNDI